MAFFLFPLPAQFTDEADNAPFQLQDREGRLLYEVRQAEYGSQSFLPFESIPQQAIFALISIEDRRFMSHWGIRPLSIARALLQNYRAQKIVSGASTITQQFVRIRMQPEKRDYLYKIWEMLLALKLETRLSKSEILEGYINRAYFGQQAYGLKAASQTFFDKQPAELSLAETAFLIGLLQSPSGYNPYRHFDIAKARQELVLNAMRESDSISAPAYEEALAEKLSLASSHVDIRAPHFVFWVLEQLERKAEAPLTPGPLQGEPPLRPQPFLRTSLDLELQTEVENIVTNELLKLEKKNVSSAAVVVLDVHSGEVLSMVGSADYFDTRRDGQVNVAVSSRQPGSALKPFTYAMALSQGDTLSTSVADIEAQFFTQEGNPYIPRNYDYGFHGLVRYREALANSYNIPAVKTLEKVGVDSLLGFLKVAGITTLNEAPEFYGVALTLGSGEVRLLELAQAFGIFPRGGRTLKLHYSLEDKEEDDSNSGEQILDERIAWLIADILSDKQARIPEFGEDSALSFDRPVAAKTGTTRNSRDNWVIGFTPDHLVGVWVGNADNSPMKDTSGVTGAGPIFHAVMEAVNKNLPPKPFQRPPGLLQKEICTLSGMLPSKDCPHTEKEWYITGTEPRQEDRMYQAFRIDSRSGLLASESCDESVIEEKVFIDFPPDLEKWSRENGHKAAPQEFSPYCRQVPRAKTPNDKEIQNSRTQNLQLPTTNYSSSFVSLRSTSADKLPTTHYSPLTITKPHQGDSFRLDPLIPDSHEQIIFEAWAEESVKSIVWSVDGVERGESPAPDFRLKWIPEVGTHRISARSVLEKSSGEKQAAGDEIRIEIIE